MPNWSVKFQLHKLRTWYYKVVRTEEPLGKYSELQTFIKTDVMYTYMNAMIAEQI